MIKNRGKKQLRLIGYDITSSKRLRLVAKVCLDYGIRVEKSVFVCDLSDDIFNAFWNTLLSLVDEDEDALFAFRVCKSCEKTLKLHGNIQFPKEETAIII